MFQTVEMMDEYYAKCEPNKPASDLQLTAVTCFFISAKNVMIEPFTLENVAGTMCYGKFTQNQFLDKEREVRQTVEYVHDPLYLMDLISHILKVVKFKFLKTLSAQKGHRIHNMISPTVDFFNEL